MRTSIFKFRSVAICTIFLAFLFFNQCTKTSDQVRVIGCITALTGSDANYGRSTRQGVDLAVEQVNAELKENGKQYYYQIVYEDDEMSPQQGPGAYQKLTTVNHVPLIIGPFGSRVVLAVAPLAEAGHTVLVSASATSDKIADAGDYIFRTVPMNKQQAKDCATFAFNKLGYKKAFILYVNDTYGVTLQTAFKEYFVQLGGAVIGEDAYEKDATNFRTQLTRIKTLKPDFVFFPGYYKEPALILKQAADIGIQDLGIKFIGTDGSCTDDLIRIAGDAAEGSFYSNLAVDFEGDDPEMQQFLSAFKTKYQIDPDAYATYYYDTFKMLAQVLAPVKWNSAKPLETAERIKTALYNMAPYKGITGTIQFDDKGEVSKSFAIMQVVKGKFVPTK